MKPSIGCQLKTVSRVYKILLWTLGLNRCCLLCAGTAPIDQPFCPGCASDLPRLSKINSCPGCSLPGTAGYLCSRCGHQGYPFNHCIAAFSYQKPVSPLLVQFKYGYRRAVLPALANPLLQRLQQHYRERPWPELILSVPQHPRRLRERGFDQAALLAQYLSTHSQIPYQRRQLIRTRHTPSQKALDEKQRRRNIRGAFALRGALAARSIALIDDVVTSGATVSELCRLLRRGGAQQIDIWALARTPQHQPRL